MFRMDLGVMGVRLSMDATKFERACMQAEHAISTLASRATGHITRMSQSVMAGLDRMSAGMRSVGRTATTFITLPLAAAAAGAISLASDAEEVGSKFSVVFSTIQREAQASADELDKAFGLSSTGARRLLGDTADLLTGFGFSQQAALDLSTQVQKLAVDLASFTNYAGGAEGASQALTKALLGEREMVKSLGIAILEKDVQQRMATLAARGMTFATEREAKAIATLEIALEQSRNALGDFARTSDSFANQRRELIADIEDMAVKFGRDLLPAARDVLGVLKDATGWFNSLSDETRQAIVWTGGLAAVAGPLIWTMGQLAVAIRGVGVALSFVAAHPVVAGIVALGAAALWAAQHFGVWDDAGAAVGAFRVETERATEEQERLNKAIAAQPMPQARAVADPMQGRFVDEMRRIERANRLRVPGMGQFQRGFEEIDIAERRFREMGMTVAQSERLGGKMLAGLELDALGKARDLVKEIKEQVFELQHPDIDPAVLGFMREIKEMEEGVALNLIPPEELAKAREALGIFTKLTEQEEERVKATRERQRITADADALIRSLRTPGEVLVDRVTEAMAMVREGAFAGREEFLPRLAESIEEDFIAARMREQSGEGLRFAGSAERGSVEAASAVARAIAQRSTLEQKAEQQRRIQQEMLQTLKSIDNKSAKARPNIPVAGPVT